MFDEVLSSIRGRVEGALAISLLSLDGIPVVTQGDSRIPLDVLGAELGTFVRSIQQANTEFNSGAVEQFSVVTEKYVTILSRITEEYFLLMVLDRNGNYGRARFELQKARYALQSELV